MNKEERQKRKLAKLRRKEQQKQLQLQAIRQQEKEQRREKRIQWIKTHLSRSKKLIVGISVVLGIAAAFFALSPHVSVLPLSSLNPSDPFATAFSITNDGPLSIHNVTFTCLLRDVRYPESHSFISNTSVDSEHRTAINIIGARERSTVSCALPITSGQPVLNADMDIVVEYRPSFWPWRIEQKFRFKTERATDKLLHWFPRADSE
jgi:hypothetical protein